MHKELKYKSDLIKSKASETGFSAFGIVPVHPLESERQALESWLAKGMHGSMGYMARNLEKRLNPAELVEGARSVITVLINYYSPLKQTNPEAPVISKYAYGKDYHFIMKDKLNQLLEFIDKEISPCKGRVFVDSAPILERAWAREAGLGWIGKNSMLISKKYGSFVFLGELIVDIELDYDSETVSDHCGTCTRCIDACPTNAIIAPKIIDARKCISYQTIENEEEIPPEITKNLNNRVFGCDICQDVCPWNKKVNSTDVPEFQPINGLLEMNKSDWTNLDKSTYDKIFHGTAFKRKGFKGIIRNLSSLGQKDWVHLT